MDIRAKKVHAMNLLLETFCASAGNVTSIVTGPGDTRWRIVTCKRCLALRRREEKYTVGEK
jgi:hypothetical protein